MGMKFNPLTGNFDLTGSGGSAYTLPTAAATTLGGVKVGDRLSIAAGVLSADVQTTDITGKASLALDNLASVAINTSLISDTDSTDDLGSSSKYWANGYVDSIYTDTINGATANGNLSIIPNGTGYTIIGNAGVTSHTFNTNDDLLVSGRLEVDGSVYFDGGSISALASTGSNLMNWYFGANAETHATLQADATLDQLALRLGSLCGRQLVIGVYGATSKDFDHATPTDPTLFIHSVTDPDTNNTQWLSLTHNQTNGVINTGLGNLTFGQTLTSDTDSTDDLGTSSIYWANTYTDVLYTSTINGSVANGNLSIIPNGTGYTIIGNAGTTSHTFNTNDDLLVSGRLEVDGPAYIDSSLYATANFFFMDGSDDTPGFTFVGSTARRVGIDSLEGVFRFISEPNGGGNGYTMFGIDGSQAALPSDRAIFGFPYIAAGASIIKYGFGLTDIDYDFSDLTVYSNAIEVMRFNNDGNVSVTNSLDALNLTTPFGGIGNWENLLTYSQAFTNAAWADPLNKITQTDNAVVAPDGTTTAATVQWTATGGILRHSVTLTNGATYTFSMWVRLNTGTAATALNIDLGDGAGSHIHPTSTWKRYSLTLVAGTGDHIDLDHSGTNTYEFWGAQLEAGTNMGPYYPTTTTAKTTVSNGALINTNLNVLGTSAFGGTIASDTDSTDDLGTSSIYWANAYIDNLLITGTLKVAGTQVVGARVVDARCDDAINSGDATTDGLIDALRDCLISHGLLAAA